MTVYNESGAPIYRYLGPEARDAFTMRYEQALTEQRRASRSPMSRLAMATRAGHGLEPDAMRELVRDVLFPL